LSRVGIGRVIIIAPPFNDIARIRIRRAIVGTPRRRGLHDQSRLELVTGRSTFGCAFSAPDPG
jgi:hypothetical protein